MSVSLKKEGLFTSLQGLGSFGHQRFGVAPGGAMDQAAARIANLLAGNDEACFVIEAHFPGPELVFENEGVFAIAGADLCAELDGETIANWKAHRARRSSTLRFSNRAFGNRAYVALRGGFASPSHDLFDPWTTRRLTTGATLTGNAATTSIPITHAAVSRRILPAYSSFPTVRVLTGAEFHLLSEEAKRTFQNAAFTLTHNSNRMGFQLDGPEITIASHPELVSAAVTFGTIQLVPSGRPIILMADHQATGGYPRIGHIISADLPLAAQLGPGDKIAFEIVGVETAHREMLQLNRDLRWLKAGLSFGRY